MAVGGPALLGAATGFLIYGLFLIPRLAPPVLVLLCMAAVSGAALVHGSEGARRGAGGASSVPLQESEESAESETRKDPASSITQTLWNSES